MVKLVDLTGSSHLERELMLIKVKVSGAQRAEVKRLAEVFRGEIVDVTPSSYVVQLTGKSDKLDAFISSLGETSILEVARTGASGISRADKVLNL